MPTFIGPITQERVIGKWTLMTQYDIHLDSFRVWVFRRLETSTEWLTIDKGTVIVQRTTKADAMTEGPPAFMNGIGADVLIPMMEGLVRDFGGPETVDRLKEQLSAAAGKIEITTGLNDRLIGILERTIMEKVR